MRFNQVEFGRRLKALRKERGMTQEELAAALSITPNHLGKIELGKRGISFDVLLFMCGQVLWLRAGNESCELITALVHNIRC